MSKKFEQLLDYLVNEEMDKANDLFHEIVVEKSREIYENMIAEESDDYEEESVEEADDQEEESVEEADGQEDEAVEEGFGMDDEEQVGEPGDEESSMSIGGENDPADSLPADVQDPSEDQGEVSSGEEQILDILSQLKSEFENIVAKNGGAGDTAAEPEFGDNDDDGDHDMDDHDIEKDDDEEGEEFDDKDESMGQPMREYVENVGMNWEKGNTMKSPGPVGSGKGDLAGQTAVDGGKSPVSSGKGKPTTGATAHNILGDRKAGTGTNTGTSPAKADMGIVKSGGKFVGNGTHNVDNVKSGVKTLGKVAQNSKTPGPVGSGSGDKAGQTSVGVVKSPLNGAPGRNA
jgi:hypothetical protein